MGTLGGERMTFIVEFYAEGHDHIVDYDDDPDSCDFASWILHMEEGEEITFRCVKRTDPDDWRKKADDFVGGVDSGY